MQQKTQKKSYFDPVEFVEQILKITGLSKSKPEIRDELALEITGLLMQRITTTIIDSFEERELFMLRKTMEDHPEVDVIDAITVIAGSIPGLNKRLEKTVDDLYEELLKNFKEIEDITKLKK